MSFGSFIKTAWMDKERSFVTGQLGPVGLFAQYWPMSSTIRVPYLAMLPRFAHFFLKRSPCVFCWVTCGRGVSKEKSGLGTSTLSCEHEMTQCGTSFIADTFFFARAHLTLFDATLCNALLGRSTAGRVHCPWLTTLSAKVMVAHKVSFAAPMFRIFRTLLQQEALM
jgi:hypothetical protein